MINIIFSIVLASISVAQVNIFEVDGIFSSAHVRSVERHFEEFEYEECSEDQSIIRDQEINK